MATWATRDRAEAAEALVEELQAEVQRLRPMAKMFVDGARRAGPGGSRLWNHRDWQDKAKKLLGEEPEE